MYLIEYLQTKHWLSRRRITDLIDNGQIFLNWEKIVSYKQEIYNSDELEIKELRNKGIKELGNTVMLCGIKIKELIKIEKEKAESEIVIFNKPIWYVVSKSDSNNKTIYEILPKQFKNYYYIWRLDKDSRGLLLLTNDPKLVNQYEHPKNEIEKEYVVQLNRFLKKVDIDRCLKWIKDGGEILKMKKLQKSQKLQNYKIILIEWKKRHIRRIFKSLWYDVLDLQRIREGIWKLGDLEEGKWKNHYQ